MKNMVLITIDALRRDSFGCYGNERSLTPFMDSLQGQSLRFDRAFATGPYTQASFPGILTSTYYLEYGKQKNLPAEKTLISEVLKKHEFHTAGFHSNPYLSAYFGYNRGWDMFYDSMEDDVTDLYPFIRGDAIVQKVESWLSWYVSKHADTPFFLWIHFMDVHEPYIPEEEYLKKVDESATVSKEEMYRLFKDVLLKRDSSNPDTVGLLKKLYDAKVLEADDYIRQLFGILADVLDRTTIIIGSDHGDEFGEHGGLSHDGKMYSELVSVPLFIYESDRRGEVHREPVSNIGIAPTIASLFGIEDVHGFRGISLLDKDEPEQPCFGEAINKRGQKEKETDHPIYFCLLKNWKLIHDTGTGDMELYDLGEDPGESQNLFGESSMADELQDILDNWLHHRL
jgi:arylsulfatase A-like enzyme